MSVYGIQLSLQTHNESADSIRSTFVPDYNFVIIKFDALFYNHMLFYTVFARSHIFPFLVNSFSHTILILYPFTVLKKCKVTIRSTRGNDLAENI